MKSLKQTRAVTYRRYGIPALILEGKWLEEKYRLRIGDVVDIDYQPKEIRLQKNQKLSLQRREKLKEKEAIKAKTVVMGAVQRGGNARLMIVPDSTAKSHGDFLNKTIDPNGTRLMTDKTNRLEKVAMGFNRHAVDHGRHEYVRGDVHANTIEAFWSHLKRSITGTHKVVSRKYLQEYLNGFVFLRDNRHSDKERFWKLLSLLTNPSTS